MSTTQSADLEICLRAVLKNLGHNPIHGPIISGVVREEGRRTTEGEVDALVYFDTDFDVTSMFEKCTLVAGSSFVRGTTVFEVSTRAPKTEDEREKWDRRIEDKVFCVAQITGVAAPEVTFPPVQNFVHYCNGDLGDAQRLRVPEGDIKVTVLHATVVDCLGAPAFVARRLVAAELAPKDAALAAKDAALAAKDAALAAKDAELAAKDAALAAEKATRSAEKLAKDAAEARVAALEAMLAAMPAGSP